MNKHINRIRQTREEKTIHYLSAGFIFIFMILCLYPFWNVFINSIATREEAVRGVYFFPKDPTFQIYADLIRDGSFLHSLFISLSRTVLSTVGCLVFSAMFAFLVTQEDLPHR